MIVETVINSERSTGMKAYAVIATLMAVFFSPVLSYSDDHDSESKYENCILNHLGEAHTDIAVKLLEQVCAQKAKIESRLMPGFWQRIGKWFGKTTSPPQDSPLRFKVREILPYDELEKICSEAKKRAMNDIEKMTIDELYACSDLRSSLEDRTLETLASICSEAKKRVSGNIREMTDKELLACLGVREKKRQP